MRYLLFVLTLAMCNCSLNESFFDCPPEVTLLIKETQKSIKTVDMKAFNNVIKNKDALIIDVREPSEFFSGRIPDAINIPRGTLEFEVWHFVGYPKKVNKSKKIYLYCNEGRRCILAARALQQLGFTEVYAVIMDIEQWQNAGYKFII